ncbi:MAG TPA: hemolysin III family protein [Ktedonobacteraceae bacterium]|nr:hemolysin III family protein [Ktedonobacteraceae bacterium]
MAGGIGSLYHVIARDDGEDRRLRQRPALADTIHIQTIGNHHAVEVQLLAQQAIVYARKWPNPFPRVLGFHEIFHLFVIAGSVAFALSVWFWAVTFPRV